MPKGNGKHVAVAELMQRGNKKIAWSTPRDANRAQRSPSKLNECFINSLTPHQVHKSLYQAAISNAIHARFVARCEALNCDLATVITEETLKEGETQGEVRIRGVDCPGIEACDEAVSGTCESYETRVLDQQERCLTPHFFLKMLSEQE